jgi:hypothetical protein
MRRYVLRLAAISGVILLLSRPTAAQNTDSSHALSLTPGGTAAETYLDTTAHVERWFQFTSMGGRSYCVETQGGPHFDDTSNAGGDDTVVTVFKSDITTQVAVNDDEGEPAGYNLSRACWISAASERTFIRLGSFPGGTLNFYARIRVVETTLFSNWFYVGGDYSAYSIIRRTTAPRGGVADPALLNYTINWRDSSGTITATKTGTLAANASTFVDAKGFAGNAAAGSGTVEIVHDGSPGAIMATTTVLSASTGLSFDTIFVPRPTW